MGKHPHVGLRTVTAHHRRQIATQPTNTVARVTANVPPSAIGRLLEEISWEGNARKYRGGGIGKENVLTTEVFSALDFLPRAAFLGAVLATASGASRARAALIDQIEAATVEVLSGDTRPSLPNGKPATWTIQPDGLITTPTALCFIEAKRLRSASFQPRQIARTAITINDWPPPETPSHFWCCRRRLPFTSLDTDASPSPKPSNSGWTMPNGPTRKPRRSPPNDSLGSHGRS